MFSRDEFPRGRFALKARLVFPVESPPIEDGVISIADGRIAAVGENISGGPMFDLGNVAILPGLINAHTHLEFSSLDQPLGTSGMRFPDWIREVMSYRGQVESHEDDLDRLRRAVQQGVRESLAAGVTTVADIVRPCPLGESTSPPIDFRESPIGYLAFREMIGLATDRVEPLLASAAAWLEQSKSELAWRPALSPHAPYTVHPELLRKVADLSAATETPVAMHLAESPQELELLTSQSGPFVDLLKDLDAWEPSAIAPGTRPLDYLKILASASRALIIHGNYLDQEAIRFLAANAPRMSVVYCPRTHSYFAHDDYPLLTMLAEGVNVAVGTDSRATNPDLDLLEELRFLARRHSKVPGETILRMGTLNAAIALGLQDNVGSIAPNKRADITCVALPDSGTFEDMYEPLFNSTKSVVATVINGRLVWSHK